MRRLILVLLAISLAACHRARKTRGNFTKPGISDDEIVAKAVVYVCDSETERCQPARIVGPLDATRITIANSDNDPGRPVRRARVIPASHIQVGDVIQSSDTSDWYVVNYADDRTVGAEGNTFTLSQIELPTARAEALDRHDRWLMSIAGIVATIMSVLFLRGARRLQLKARHHAWVTQHADEAGPKKPEPKRKGTRANDPLPVRDPTQLAALTCKNCGAAVMLVGSEKTTCTSCKQSVDIPADYVALVTSREEIAKKLPAEASVFRRARILGHPLFALAIILSSYGTWKLYGLLVRVAMASGLSSAAGTTGFIVTFPMLFAPLAVFVSGVGQLLGGVKLRGTVPALAAVKDDKGYACRGCGAALGSTTDGVAELCLYCGTQNLIAANVAASASKASATSRALDVSIRSASSAFWSRFDGIWVPVLYTLGFVGLVLNPIVAWVGLTT
ncbi:MAG TPA: hypothetical protein VGM90_17610 [Kofleriaceae bacterium]|jgi:hypothetical protein